MRGDGTPLPRAASPELGAAGGDRALPSLSLSNLCLGWPASAYALTADGSDDGEGGGGGASNDLASFAATRQALLAVGFTAEEERDLFGALAALLHLGDVRFEDHADGRARAQSGEAQTALE